MNEFNSKYMTDKITIYNERGGFRIHTVRKMSKWTNSWIFMSNLYVLDIGGLCVWFRTESVSFIYSTVSEQTDNDCVLSYLIAREKKTQNSCLFSFPTICVTHLFCGS